MADIDNVIRLAAMQEKGQEVRPNSEDGLALAFAERYADELRYVATWGRWRHYDGTRWAYDDTLHVFDRVRALCRETALECAQSGKPSASAKTVAAVERLARSDRRLAATVGQWDAEPWLLNTPGSTFDLRTGDGLPPAHLDYLTKQTACAAAPPGHASPAVEQFPGPHYGRRR